MKNELKNLTLENLSNYSFDEIFNDKNYQMNETFIRQESEPYFAENDNIYDTISYLAENDNIYDTICFDGYALLNNNENNNIHVVTYPKIVDLTIEQIETILNYCGLDNSNEIDFFSVYLKYGILKETHIFIKK